MGCSFKLLRPALVVWVFQGEIVCCLCFFFIIVRVVERRHFGGVLCVIFVEQRVACVVLLHNIDIGCMKPSVEFARHLQRMPSCRERREKSLNR